jgi:hypothetical protein
MVGTAAGGIEFARSDTVNSATITTPPATRLPRVILPVFIEVSSLERKETEDAPASDRIPVSALD